MTPQAPRLLKRGPRPPSGKCVREQPEARKELPKRVRRSGSGAHTGLECLLLPARPGDLEAVARWAEGSEGCAFSLGIAGLRPSPPPDLTDHRGKT